MGSLYGGNFRTRTFSDVWNDVDSFIEDYTNNGLNKTISDETSKTLYFLLYSRYGNSHIASSDENRFKYGLFSIIWQYGPTWERRIEIQKRLRELSEDELSEGSKQIYNTANNPDTDPSIDDNLELQFISNQSVSKNRRGILERYDLLWNLLKNDITEVFLNRFRNLFLTIVEPESPLWYEV